MLHKKSIAFFFVITFLCMGYVAEAHSVNYAMEKAPVEDVVGFYIRQGILHKMIVYPLSLVIALVAAYWTFERIYLQ